MGPPGPNGPHSREGRGGRQGRQGREGHGAARAAGAVVEVRADVPRRQPCTVEQRAVERVRPGRVRSSRVCASAGTAAVAPCTPASWDGPDENEPRTPAVRLGA